MSEAAQSGLRTRTGTRTSLACGYGGACRTMPFYDGRVSGTAYGTLVLHVVPKAAAEGLLGVVETGACIILDVLNRTLSIDVPQEELDRRVPNAANLNGFAYPKRGWARLYVDHVMQADSGADLDFLGASGSKVSRESY